MSSSEPSTLAQALYRRELIPWTLAGCTLGLVEGATAAILVKRGFAGVVSNDTLNLAVAFVSGSPALANMTSFLWANLAHGREKIRLLVWQLATFGALVAMIGLSPRATVGLAFTVISVLLARMVWAGVLTVRAAVWSANYPRAVLAQVTGRIVVFTSLGMVATAALAGLLLQTRPQYASLLFVLAGGIGLIAAWLYRRARVRQSFRLKQAEEESAGKSQVFSLGILRDILRTDPTYRQYMTWMALYGAGNLMIGGQLVIMFSDQLHIPAAHQVALLTVIPLLCVPLFTPWWARRFDASHVIEFRARQCWSLVAAMTVASVGVFLNLPPLLWLAAVLFGVSTAGANLGWNLGHNDFATLGKVQQYMGVNVTLTGMRGLLAPPLGVVVYTSLEKAWNGAGRYALLLPLAITLTGALGFRHMHNTRQGQSRI
jgi:MFS family permease